MRLSSKVEIGLGVLDSSSPSSFHSTIALIHKAKPFVCFFLLSFEKQKKEQHKKIFGEKATFTIVEHFFFI